MTRLEFFAKGIPKGQPRPRAFARRFGDKWTARVYDAKTAEGWKSCVAEAAKPHVPAVPLSGPLRLTLEFFMPRPKAHLRKNGERKPGAPDWHTGKPDCDNLAKAVMDAMSILGFWQDDAQVVVLETSKSYAAEASGCDITLTSLYETDHDHSRLQGRDQEEAPVALEHELQPAHPV